MNLPWIIIARKGDYVLAAFATEAAARDYARWRNDGRRNWIVKETTPPIAAEYRLSDLEMSVRLQNVLSAKYGDITLSDLRSISVSELEILPGITRKALKELAEVLDNVA